MKKLAAFLIIAGITISGCLDIPDQIIFPEWDVDLNVPLLNKTYKFEDILGDQENLTIGEDSIYLLHTREYTQNWSLLEFIKLDQAVSQKNISMAPVSAAKDVYLVFRTDVVQIDSAIFSGGYFKINVRNQSSLTTNFEITIPGITLDGNILVVTASLDAGESREIRQELAGCKYSEPVNQPIPFKNTLWVTAQSNATGVNTGGSVLFDVEISDFYFSSVSGRFTEQPVGRKTDLVDAHLGENLGDFRNKVKLKSALLKLSAFYQSIYNNSFKLKVDSLTFRAIHNGEEMYLTDSTGSRYLHFTVEQGTADIVLNETNSNIEDIVNFFPDVFEISASFRIIGNNQYGTVTSGDLSGVSIDINTKSILALARSSVTDTIAIKISQSDRDDIKNAVSGSLKLEIENAIPLNGWIKIDFADSLMNPVLSINIENADTFFVSGAPVNSITGEVIAPSSSLRKVELSQDDIFKLAATYYIILSASVETSSYNFSDPVLVMLRASDWLRLNLSGLIKYHVNANEL